MRDVTSASRYFERGLPELPARAEAGFSPDHQLVIGRYVAPLNWDGSAVRFNKVADPTPTLSVAEIEEAAPEQKRELLRRYVHFLAVASGASTTASLPQKDVKLSSGPFTVSATRDGSITFAEKKGRTLSIELAGGEPRVRLDPPSEDPSAPLQMMLEVFERMLLCRGSLTDIRREKEPAALQLFDLLLGPSGALNPDNTLKLDAGERYQNTKLHFWDYNGTVERSMNPPTFRPDMAAVARSLIRMGAVNALTTSVPADRPAEIMDAHGIAFNAHFGRDEVRPDRGNKEYRGLAQAHGISASQAPHRVMVIGDSATDAPRPGDLPGVLFVYSSASTPAEAIQLLTHGLDRLGNGSYARGLEKAAGGKITEQPQRVTLGAVEFDVQCPKKDPSWTGDNPVISNLRLSSSDQQIQMRLKQKPAAEQQSALAEYDFTLRFIEERLPEQRLLPLFEGRGYADPDAVMAAGRKRQEIRRYEVGAARQNVERLEGLMSGAAAPDALLDAAKRIANAGDPQAASALVELSKRYDALTATAEQDAKANLEALARDLSQAIEEALAAQGDQPVGRAEARTLSNGLFPDSGYELVAAIDKLQGCEPEAVAALLTPIQQDLADWTEGRREELTALFARRRAISGDIAALAERATEIAGRRSATWEKIDAAIESFSKAGT